MVDVKYVDERAKREDEMQGDDYRANSIDSNGILLPTPPPARGDIPSTDIDCDGKKLYFIVLSQRGRFYNFKRK